MRRPPVSNTSNNHYEILAHCIERGTDAKLILRRWADGEVPPAKTAEPPDLAAFVASLSSAWHAGEIRPTFSIEAKPRYLRSLQRVSAQTMVSISAAPLPATSPVPAPMSANVPERPKLVYAQRGNARIQAVRTVWPIVFRRLEALPNVNAMQLFEELCFEFPGRFTYRQYKTLLRRVNAGAKTLVREASLSVRKPTGESATNRVASVRTSSKTTGRR
jgi:hypothetical protein